MLKLGIIEKSTSPWSSPIVCTEKKSNDIRLCLDARKIYTVIIPDRECPTNMEILQFASVYVDDIHITSRSFEEHIQHLEHIFP
jgi:hypothetical protein